MMLRACAGASGGRYALRRYVTGALYVVDEVAATLLLMSDVLRC